MSEKWVKRRSHGCETTEQLLAAGRAAVGPAIKALLPEVAELPPKVPFPFYYDLAAMLATEVCPNVCELGSVFPGVRTPGGWEDLAKHLFNTGFRSSKCQPVTAS